MYQSTNITTFGHLKMKEKPFKPEYFMIFICMTCYNVIAIKSPKYEKLGFTANKSHSGIHIILVSFIGITQFTAD